MNQAIHSEQRAFAALLVGLYVWAVVAFFGVTLVDTAYVAVLRDEIGAEDRAAIFAEVGDFLLLMFGATLLAALALLGFAPLLQRAPGSTTTMLERVPG